MRLDFPFIGEGGAGGGRRLSFPRRLIARRMRNLDVRPLDYADDTVRFGVYIALGFVGIFALFALLAPISGAAIAPGEVSVAGNAFVIQPAGSGIVTEIMVKEGQMVRAGQPLVRMNGVRSGAQLKQTQARRDALRAVEARLIAERDGAVSLIFPPDLAQRGFDPAAAKAMATQQLIWSRHAAVLGADRGSSDEGVIAARARQAASAKQLALIEDELADYRMLYRRGFARLTTIRSLERQQAQLMADTTAGGATLAQAEIAAKRVRDSQMLDIAGQLSSTQEQLAQVTPQLDVTRYMADQDLLRAPVAGRVSGVVSMGPGMVVSGGRTLMSLVPNSKAFVIDARIKPGDIDDVRIGQEATIRFSTVVPHGKTAFKGHVVTLSPASITEGGQAYYKAQVVLDNPAEASREGLTLQPGIPASVNVKTKDRTLFGYLFAPFADAMSRSFREE